MRWLPRRAGGGPIGVVAYTLCKEMGRSPNGPDRCVPEEREIRTLSQIATRSASVDELLSCYGSMLMIRAFEEKLGELFSRGEIGGTSHFCIGQEACAVGVVSACRDTDYIVSNHRGHGHLLARGLDPVRVFAELMGRTAGYCGGRGGYSER